MEPERHTDTRYRTCHHSTAAVRPVTQLCTVHTCMHTLQEHVRLCCTDSVSWRHEREHCWTCRAECSRAAAWV